MKYIKPEDLSEKYKTFSPNLAVTEGQFEIDVPNLLGDMEWNHMDQLHRPYIHHTYEEAVRIALGKDFSVSLTRWNKWPFFITVSDIRIQPGLYYQIMTIMGLIFVHLVISMEEKNEIVHLKIKWFIASHKWLKFLHKRLSRKFFKLNTRLQIEDSQIREQRYDLRKKGYRFASDPVDYHSSNTLGRNVIYPDLPPDTSININQLLSGKTTEFHLGPIGFLVKKNQTNEYLLWPSVCPHEGGNLIKGKECDKDQIQCPWHGLRFSAVKLSQEQQTSSGFGFDFFLKNDMIQVEKAQ